MKHISIVAWRMALLAALGLSPLATPAWAATYKCTVDGKTVYQQAPCGPGSEGEAMRIQSAPQGGAYSGTDLTKMRQQVQNEGPRLARESFDRLKSGRIDEYVANLCPTERKSFGNPTIKGSLKAEGANLASGKFEFMGRPVDTQTLSQVFEAWQDPFGARDTSKPPKRMRVNVTYGRDLGQLCLRAMSFWSGS
jgi:hypothetical protein